MPHMHLAGFLIAGPVAHSHALWRHPQSQLEFLQPDYYQQIAQILEQGKFDLVFFADRLALSDRYGGDLQIGVQYGDQDAFRLDPVPVLSIMAASIQRIGLGATRSTTYYHPYQVARSFATLDHLTRGRAAWNVVTSVNDGEAKNFGLSKHLEHDRRYDRADEFLELTLKLWQSWQPDALQLDQQQGILADPAKVNYVEHQGEWFQSRGPLNVPRSPQGHPVLIQAGASGRGRQFAARWAEVIFTIQPDLASAQKFYADMQARLADCGRTQACKILLAIMPFVGATEALAVAKRDEHNQLVHPLVGLSTLSNHLNYDFSQHDLNQPLEAITVQGMRGIYDLIAHLSQTESLSLAALGQRYGASVLVPQLVGTAAQIATQMRQFFEARACDGFVISPAFLPGAFAEFVEQVIPELQRQDLFRKEYSGSTLRDHLNLPISDFLGVT